MHTGRSAGGVWGEASTNSGSVPTRKDASSEFCVVWLLLWSVQVVVVCIGSIGSRSVVVVLVGAGKVLVLLWNSCTFSGVYM